MSISKDDSQMENARRLRREMTPHERMLWYLFLRKYPVKIYKQRIIGRFIVDFYYASAKSALDLAVLRFSNRDIDRDFRGVCEQIDIAIQNRLHDPLSHLR